MSKATAMGGGEFTRRGFLKTTAAVAGLSALMGTGSTLAFADEEAPAAFDVEGEIAAIAEDGEQIFNCNCRSNCMGSCRLLAHVRDGKLVKLSPGEYTEPGYTSACLKGLSYIERIYSPGRIQYPLRRVAGTERGAGEWERITWEEAIADVAANLGRIAEEYGGNSIIFEAASGNYGYLNGVYGLWPRLCAVLGATKTTGCYDYACGHGIDRVLATGDWQYCNEPNSVLDATMEIIWGTNPVLTHPHNWRWIQQAKEQGTHVLCIDPIKSATAHRSSEWLRVNPGHDGYLALAMSNFIIERGLIDEEFLTTKSNGIFLVRRDNGKFLRLSDIQTLEQDEKGNFIGDDFLVWSAAAGGVELIDDCADPVLDGSFTTENGIEVDTSYKLLRESLAQYTIEEAARLTGLGGDVIADLAERIAAEPAVSVNISYGLDHYVNGYLNCWSIAILLALTGNFMKDGAGFTGVFTTRYSPETLGLWITEEFKGLNTAFPTGLLPQVAASGELGGKPFPVKAMITYCSNLLGNAPSLNDHLEKLYGNLEYSVVIDSEMTDSAKYADIILPCAMWYEVEDVRAGYDNPYFIYQEKAIEPLYESKADWQICAEIGRAMGFTKSFPEDMSVESLCAILFSNEASKVRNMSLERLRKEKFVHTTGEPGKKYITGLTEPLKTEKSRVRLYTENPVPRINYGQDLSERVASEHIVYYRDPAEAGIDNPLAEKYPLVFLQEHSRFRVHGQWARVKTLSELDPEPLAKINGADAAARGVADGDIIEVFNDRGRCVIKAYIDESIAPGVISIPKGWQMDQHIEGSYQSLTQLEMDPYPSASSFYDSRVEFRKA